MIVHTILTATELNPGREEYSGQHRLDSAALTGQQLGEVFNHNVLHYFNAIESGNFWETSHKFVRVGQRPPLTNLKK